MTEDQKRRSQEARETIIRGIGQHADTYEYAGDGLITGFVVVYEVTKVNGNRSLLWMSGDGEEPEAERGHGLQSWRAEGMLRQAIRDVCNQKYDTDDDME